MTDKTPRRWFYCPRCDVRVELEGEREQPKEWVCRDCRPYRQKGQWR